MIRFITVSSNSEEFLVTIALLRSYFALYETYPLFSLSCYAYKNISNPFLTHMLFPHTSSLLFISLKHISRVPKGNCTISNHINLGNRFLSLCFNLCACVAFQTFPQGTVYEEENSAINLRRPKKSWPSNMTVMMPRLSRLCSVNCR